MSLRAWSLGVVFVVGCGGGGGTPAAEPTPAITPLAESAANTSQPAADLGAVADERPVPDGWIRFVDDKFGFSVDAPVEPTSGVQDVPTAIGMLKAYTYSFALPNAQGAMLAMVTPSYFTDAADTQKLLDDGQAGALQSMNATLVSSEDTVLDTNPGRVFRFTAMPQGMPASGVVHVYLRDGALYQVMTVYADAAPDYAAVGEQFVESFRFTAKK
jgi:hypothetical protein